VDTKPKAGFLSIFTRDNAFIISIIIGISLSAVEFFFPKKYLGFIIIVIFIYLGYFYSTIKNSGDEIRKLILSLKTEYANNSNSLQESCHSELSQIKEHHDIFNHDLKRIILGPIIYERFKRTLLRGKMMAERGSGKMIWFNVPLGMLIDRESVVDFLIPALQNVRIDSIKFKLRTSVKDIWDNQVISLLEELYPKYKEKTSVSFSDKLEDIFVGYKYCEEVSKTPYEYSQLMIWKEPFMKKIEEKGVFAPFATFTVSVEDRLHEDMKEFAKRYM